MFNYIAAGVVFVLACLASYVANIIKLLSVDLALAEYTITEILRCIGILFPPLGIIMGFI